MERTRKKEESKGKKGKEGGEGGKNREVRRRACWCQKQQVLGSRGADMAESHDSSDLIYFATKFIVLAGLSSGHPQKWE